MRRAFSVALVLAGVLGPAAVGTLAAAVLDQRYEAELLWRKSEIAKLFYEKKQPWEELRSFCPEYLRPVAELIERAGTPKGSFKVGYRIQDCLQEVASGRPAP